MNEVDIKYYINLVNEKIQIQDVLYHYGISPSKGRYSYKCPFHGPDKKPSGSTKSGIFHCFTCNKSWDVTAFVKEYEKLDSMWDALKIVDGIFALQMFKPLSYRERKALERKESLRKKQEERAKRLIAFETEIRQKIVNKLRVWENVQRLSHITQKQYKTGEWEYSALFFESLKKQEYLNWLYDVLCENLHPENIYDLIYGNDKKEILKLIYNEEITI